jgi:hypothetical protein
MRRWIKVMVAAAMVLAVGGWIGQPYAKDWVLAGQACDGALPRDVTGRLVPDDAHLTEERSQGIDGLGSYGCDLRFDGDDGAVGHIVLDAYTQADDQDAQFMGLFPNDLDSMPTEALPDGLPGFVDEFRVMHLLVRCPDLGKDANGRQRDLLTRISLQRHVEAGAPGAAYGAAVSLTNAASDRLGCGVKPLTPPKKDVPLADPARHEEAHGISLAAAKNTTCGWAAGAGLPEPTAWHALGTTSTTSPVGGCSLYTEDSPSANRSWMSFNAWYGDWSGRLTRSFKGDLLTVSATARCDGETATFLPKWTSDIPGIGKADRLRIFKLFAEDQVRLRGCSGLRFSF